MEQDKIISEVRLARERLSFRFDNDIDRIVAFFQEEEKKNKSKIRNFQRKQKKTRSAQ
jgi:hypothetical protein